MAKKNTNTVAPETTVASTPKLTLAEQLDKACSGFLDELKGIMDNAMSNTRNARDRMLVAVADYRTEVGKQDELADVILSVGSAIVDMGETHIAEVATYENTLGILDDLDEEIASLDNVDALDEDEIVDEIEDFDLGEDTDETHEVVAVETVDSVE